MSNILQDMLGMLTRKAIVTPKLDDNFVISRYASPQERLKPMPAIKTELVTLSSIKTLIVPAAVVGATGTFTTADSKTVTVTDGIIVSIV